MINGRKLKDFQQSGLKNLFIKKNISRSLSIILGICLPISLTIASFFFIRGWENQRFSADFERHSDSLASDVQTKLSGYAEVLQSIAAFYRSSPDITRQEFHTFVEHSLEQHPGIQALEWIPHVLDSDRATFEKIAQLDGYSEFQFTEHLAQGQMVPAVHRDEYFPVYYVEPYKGNELALGFDMASNSIRLEALTQARDTGKMIATAPITLVQETAHQSGFLVYMPIYNAGTPPLTVQERRQNLQGFALGVFRIGDMMSAFLQPAQRDMLEIELYDEDAPAGEQLLYASHSDTGQEQNYLSGNKEAARNSHQVQYLMNIDMAGRQWLLRISPTPDYLTANRAWYSWIILLIGLLFTYFAGFYMFRRLRYAIAMETLTQELSRNNETLKEEVTYRRRVEEELKASEEKFRSLVDNVNIGITRSTPDFDGRYIAVNAGMARIVGYTVEELMNMKIKDIYLNAEERASLVTKIMTHPGYTEFETHLKSKDGTVRLVLIKAAPVLDDGGKLLWFDSITEDITERKQAEQKLKVFSDAVSEAIDAIGITDMKGSITYANPAMEAIYGYEKGELLGTPVLRLNSNVESASTLLNSLLENRGWVGEIVAVKKNGKTFPAALSISLIRDDQGNPVAMMGASRDITERKLAEEVLKRTEENFRRSLDDSPLGIRIIDSNGEAIYANKALLQMYGYENLEELNRIPSRERYTPESYSEYLARREKRKQGEHVPPSYEISIVRKNGEIRHLEAFRKEVLWNSHPQFQVVYNDITERKRAEENIKNLARFPDENPNPVLRIAYDGSVLYANSGSKPLLDYWQIKVGEKNSELTSTLIKQAIQDNQVFQAEIDTGGRIFTCFFTPIAPAGYINIYGIDTTERKKAEEYLRESEYQLKKAQKIGRIGSWEFDVEHQSISWSEETYALYERDPQLGPPSLEEEERYYSPQQAKELRDYAQRAITIGQAFTFDLEVKLPSGKTAYYHSAMHPVKNAQGRVVKLYGIVHDITERKQMEEKLRESEQKYATLVEKGNDGIVLIQRGLVHFANSKILEMTGFTSAEALGKPFSDFVAPEHRATLLERHQKRMAGEAVPSNYECAIVARDGREIPVEISANMIEFAGEPADMAFVRDITERKRTQDEIKRLLDKESQTAKEWQETFDAVADIVVLLSPRHEILRINKSGYEAVNKKAEELIGKKCYEVVHGLPFPLKNCPCIEALETKKSHTSEVSERGRHYLLTAYPIVNRDGQVISFAHIVKDITERKKAEAEKRELEVKALSTSRLALIGEMAASIAHEINNPLTPVLGFAEMLMERNLPDDVKADLKIICESAKRTADVTRRMLTFARQRKPFRTQCDINAIFESTLQLRAYYLRSSNIKVIKEFSSELPQIMADAGQLQQVLLNLIMNAEYEMSHAHEGGNLLVGTERIGDYIRILVKDDGLGIPEKNMAKLFTPFFTTKKVGEGTGLGLSVCHGIVTEHNGRIYAESAMNQGATFIIELPIVIQPQGEESKQLETTMQKLVKASKARILVVDDEPAIVQVLQKTLVAEGYKVKAAATAKEALGLVENGEYELILLDIKLPDMSGIEVYKRLEKVNKPVIRKIIFMTGDVMGEATRDFFVTTKATCIAKPFDVKQVKREIENKLSAIKG